MTNRKSDIIDNMLKLKATNKNSPAADASTTIPESKEYESWDTIPDNDIYNPRDFYEDVLTEESIQEEVAQATIRNLLQPSEQLRKKIVEYIKSKNLQTVDEYTPFQTFTFDGQTYLLDHDVDVANIQAMILDMSSHTILEHTLNKRPNTLYEDLMRALENKKAIFETMMVTNKLPLHVVFKLIIRAFSKMINYKLARQMETKFEFNLRYTAEKLGELVFDAIVYYNFIYNIDAEVVENEENNNKKVKEFVKRDPQEILKLLKQIRACSTLPKESTRDSELDNVIQICLENYLENLSIEFQRVKSKEDSQIDLAKYQIKLGLKIVDILVDANILRHFTDNKKVPCIKIIYDVTIQLFASASFYKPRITFGKYESVYKVNRNEHISVELDVKQELIKNNSEVKIQGNKELYEVMEKHARVPYVIDSKQFNDFVAILETMLLAREKIADLNSIHEEIFAMINALYDIDCRQLRENNKDKELVLEIIKYGLALTSFYEKSLMTKVKGNLACENAYNVMSSYKYTIKGMINDLNLYKDFGHFFIDKFVTSTGRIFSSPYFLQLQGIKLVLGFITFKKNPHFEISKIVEILKDYLPAKIGVDNYLKNIRGVYNQYILSLCTSGTNLTEFQDLESFNAELIWLEKHSKKKVLIFYIRSLIYGGINNNYLHRVYEKDATSSGLQIISILLRDISLAKECNIVGDQVRDIYTEFTNIYKKKIIKDVTILEGILQNLFSITLEEFLNKENKTIPEYFRSLCLESDIKIVKTNYAKNKSKIEQLTFVSNLKNYKIPFFILGQSNDILLLNILKLNQLFTSYLIVSKLPFELITRNLFKKPVMTLGYSAGSSSRIAGFKEYIKQQYIELGYHEILISSIELDVITMKLEEYFNLIAKEKLSAIFSFLSITRTFVNKNNNKSLKIRMKYLTWNLRIVEKILSQHKIGKYRFDIYNSFGISESEIKTTFPSIFVQGLDAHIVYSLLDKVEELNQRLRDNNLPEISITTNHDCFGINTLYALILIPLVQEAYNSINKLELRDMPELLNKRNKVIECQNPNCIKH